MYRLPKSLPAISIFHNPASPHSQRVLHQLRDAVSKPYPPSDAKQRPLEFELEVVENEPTKSQLNTIRSYLSLPPNSEAKLEQPIVVNWNDGVAAAGQDAPGSVLETIRAKRDSPDSGSDGAIKKKGFFGWFS
ncbi:hypothetical protein AURDEDRAFT_183894 [Auricularia subglabra TFB-10046 SS5]|nr:hypothetical protein AURDEDRAFT_183894 [Auricularia subglabra TFB-10046 SS5]